MLLMTDLLADLEEDEEESQDSMQNDTRPLHLAASPVKQNSDKPSFEVPKVKQKTKKQQIAQKGELKYKMKKRRSSSVDCRGQAGRDVHQAELTTTEEAKND